VVGDRVAREVDVDVGLGLEVAGVLTVPRAPRGVVVFAQGSASSRLRPSNRRLARALNVAGFATLLFDLLTLPEAAEQRNIFDIPLLAQRLTAATSWLRRHTEGALGYLGASTGGAAALTAAAEIAGEVSAVVLRGGRTDLAEPRLARVTAPTLLIVGGDDRLVLEYNRRAQSRLRCPNELVVIPGATHQFQEHGALDQVADLAIAWFTRHLSTGQRTFDPPAVTTRPTST
jgi:putative phosphoribosyl transferase